MSADPESGYVSEASVEVRLLAPVGEVLLALRTAEPDWTEPKSLAVENREALYTRRRTDTGMSELALEWKEAAPAAASVVARSYVSTDRNAPHALLARLAAMGGAVVVAFGTRSWGLGAAAGLVFVVVAHWLVGTVLPGRVARRQVAALMDAALARATAARVIEVEEETIEFELK